MSPVGRRITLGGNRLTVRMQGEPDTVQVLATVEQLREALSGVFGIGLPPAELLDPALQRVIDQAPKVQ